ncbi:MAG: FkbM family methyltransferase [Candidatus Kapabacteria bacterium]|nr:FkbM family methyltransferase [Candidatus Kapabacteria bacterium]
MNQGAVRLYNKLKDKNYSPKNICEIGVYLPDDSNILHFINDNIAATLVEADPNTVKIIKKYFTNHSNVKIIEAAVFDFHGKIELSRRESSTFITQLEASPALINDNYQVNQSDQFIAESILFSEIDKGDFDLISIDIEGAEWFVLKYMSSRPDIISIETHGKYYTNPNIGQINDWMRENNYIKWYKDNSDTLFVKKNIFNITIYEKIQLIIMNLSIAILKKKKLLKKIF